MQGPTRLDSLGTGLLVRLPFYYGWVVLGVFMVAGSMAAASSQPFMAVMLKPITEEFGWSRTEATTAISIGTIGTGFVSPFIGRLADRYGPRFVVPLGGILLGAAFFFIAGVNALWQFYLAYILARSVASPCLSGVGAQTSMVNWFTRKRGRAVGLIVMTFPLANAIQAPVAEWLNGVIGWREVFVLFGAMSLVVIVAPGFLLLRKRPEDMGLFPDGASGPVEVTRGGRSMPAGARVRDFDFTLKQALRTKVFWLLVAASFLSILGGGAVSFHQVAYYSDLGLTPTIAAASISTFTLAGAFSSGLWGFVSERVSERLLAAGLTALGALVVLAMLEVNTGWMALTVSGVFGLTTRGGGTLFNLLLAGYYGRANFGAISGFFSTFSSFGLGTGPFIGAIVFDLSGNYRLLFMALSATYLATALIMLLFVREPPLPTSGEEESGDLAKVA
jgi:MFS family permease